MNRELRIGTRGSLLAVAQAERVASELRRRYPELTPVLVKIKTSGDMFAHIPLSHVGGKGLFIKEIEEALLDGQVDVAVHSMKDVPTEIAPGLSIAAILEREDASDVLISRRGNLDTRLRKLDTEGLDALVVAAAGVNRLGRQQEITEVLPLEISLPAVGQGALGLEIRAHDQRVRDLVEPMTHGPSALTIAAERAFLKRLGGGCQVPIAAYGRLDGAELHLMALVINPDGTGVVRGERKGPSALAEEIGLAIAEELLRRGADRIIRELSGTTLEPPAAP